MSTNQLRHSLNGRQTIIDLSSSFLCILVILFSVHLKAQTNSERDSFLVKYAKAKDLKNSGQIDASYDLLHSLLYELPASVNQDSLLIEMHIYLAKLKRTTSWPLAWSHYQRALKQFENNFDNFTDKGFGVYLYYMAANDYKYYTKDLDSTNLFFQRAFKLDSLYDVKVKTYAYLCYSYGITYIYPARNKELLRRNALSGLERLESTGLKYADLKLALLDQLTWSIGVQKVDNIGEMGELYKEALLFGRNAKDSLKNLRQLGRIALNAAYFFESINEYESAVESYNEAALWVSKDKPVNEYLTYLIKSSKIRAEAHFGNTDEAIEEHTRLVNFAQSNLKHNPNLLMNIFQNQSEILIIAGENALAEGAIQEFKAYAGLDVPNPQGPYVSEDFRNLSDFYFKNKQYDLSIDAYLKSKSNNQNELPAYLAQLAFAYAQIGDIPQSEAYQNQAMEVFSNFPKNYAHIQDIPLFIKQILGTSDLLYQKTEDSKHLDNIKLIVGDHYQEYFNTLQSLQSNTISAGLLNSIHELIEDILELNKRYKFLDPNGFYVLVENLRSHNLVKERSKNAHWASYEVKPEIRQERRELINDMIERQNDWYGNTDPGEQENLQHEIILIKEKLQSLENTHGIPEDYSGEIYPGTEDFAALQSRLDSDQALIISFMGRDNAYFLIIDRSEATLLDFPATQEAISGYLTSISEQNELTPLLSGLADKLSRYKKLVIIPDGSLHYLPFELLQLDNEKRLIDFSAINYYQSAKLWLLENTENRNKRSAPLFAFAPEFDGPLESNTDSNSLITELVRAGQFALPYANEEAKEISGIWEGKLIVDPDHLKKTFIRNLKKEGILHLATHALYDKDHYYQSQIYLGDETDQRITLQEISYQHAASSLITLSACNTGMGSTFGSFENKSLARAFIAAGAESVVMSLWRVPDRPTSEIMVSFYKNLATGLPKDEALRLAKLTYLKDVEDPSLAHPYYWAGFVVFGDTSPLVPPGSKWWYWIIGGFVCVGLGYMVLRNQKAA